MQVYYDKDADLSIIQGMKVVVVGYGSQGHAHANNLRDSGVKNLVVGLRKGSGSWRKAENAGLKVAEVPAAVKDADVVMILTPDELQPALYRDQIEPNLKEGATIAFGARLQYPFPADRTAQGSRRDHDRAEGPGAYRALDVRRGRRRAEPHRDRAGFQRFGEGNRSVVCVGERQRDAPA